MTRDWLIMVGVLGLSPLLAEANWRENIWLPSTEPAASQMPPEEQVRKPPFLVAQRSSGNTEMLRVSSGDTLASLLHRLGVSHETQRQVISALSDEFDPRRLQPGNRVSLTTQDDGQPMSAAIERASGVRYVVTLGERPKVSVVQPRIETLVLGREIEIEASLYAALTAEALPASFAADLDVLLGRLMDTSRDITGGERLQLLWEEDRREDGTKVGPVRLRYVSLSDRSKRLEVIWPEGQSGPVMLFKDGNLQDTLRLPVIGARLTSPFGNRRHPLYGGIRRHDGIDLAAPRGTPVMATAPGRISFIGRRGGYGRVVEVEHQTGTISRYTHLSRFSSSLVVGDSIKAGDKLGEVGASGLATGPNLHYEVRVDDRPVDPIEEGQRIILSESPTRQDYRSALFEARARLQEAIGTSSVSGLVALDNR